MQISSLYGPIGRDRRRHRRRSRGHLDRHRDHVVDQQRDRADLRDPRAEVLPGHHVGAAGPDVDHDDLAVGQHHQRHHEQDDQGHREDQGERGQARHRDQRDQDFLGAVGGGRDPVGRQDAERERLGQPLLAELLVDERRPEQLRLRRVPEGVRLAAGPVEQARRLGHRHCVRLSCAKRAGAFLSRLSMKEGRPERGYPANLRFTLSCHGGTAARVCSRSLRPGQIGHIAAKFHKAPRTPAATSPLVSPLVTLGSGFLG